MNTKTREELTQFFVIAFAFSWLIWMPGVLIPDFKIPGKVLEIIGAFGPAIAALVLTARNEGKAGIKCILANACGAKCKWGFLLIASLMLLGLHAISRLVYGLISIDLPDSEMLASPVEFIPLFVIMLLAGGGLNEEIGWRGYALDRFQNRFSPLTASLLLSILWILWHLPVFFLPGTNQSQVPFWLFSLAVIPLGVMMTWVYNNSGKSIFAAAFFHTIGNLSHELFRIMPIETNSALTGFVILTVLYFIAAVAVVVLVQEQKV